MSYDLAIFGSQALTREDLTDVIRSIESFDVAEQPGAGDHALTVVGGAERDYVCTVAGPYGVQPDDVPADVAAVVESPQFMYAIVVEGSMPTAVEAAVGLARALATVVRGATTDDQVGEVWSHGQPSPMSKPTPGRTVDIVELHWHAVRAQAAPDSARRYVELCARHLPEALPTRYGNYEPLQGNWSDGGDAAFVQAALRDGETLHFRSTRPCLEGSLASTVRGPGDKVITHSLSIERGALTDLRVRNGLRSLFVEFAEESGSFFALAEVVRGLTYDGRELSYAATTERTVSLARKGRWHGLPPYPAWWTWYAKEYADMVKPHMDTGQISELRRGTFHSWGDRPLDRDAIALQLARDEDSAEEVHATWLPLELLATVSPRDARFFNPPLTPASSLPPQTLT